MLVHISCTCVCLCFIFFLINFLNKLWWTPIRIKWAMESQGIKGPPCRFLHGSSKEVLEMLKQANSSSMELSHQVFPKLLPHIHVWTKLHGKNYLSWRGPRAEFVVTEPDLIKEIINNKDIKYHKPEFQFSVKKTFGDGLLTTKGEKWFKQRRLANHAFHGDNLKGMVPAMVAGVEKMMERWRTHQGKEIDVFKEFEVLTSEIISRTAFESSYLDGETLFQMLKKLIHLLSKNTYKIRIPGIEKFLKTKDEIEADRLEQSLRDLILKMVKERENKMKIGQADSYGSDYLGVLVKAFMNTEEDKHISMEDLIDECKTFYIAGHETTMSSLTWTVLLLAIHTDWQEKARKEVLEVLGQQHPTSDGIAKLSTMTMIVNESLRLYPPITGMLREVKKGIKLGKISSPGNMEVIIPTLALHHSPEIWGEDVYLFKPERFAEGVAKATKNNITSFFPFGLGPRTCVGMNFAITEVKIVLSMILQRYSFTLSPTYVHSPLLIIATLPQYGVQVKLQPL